MLFQVRGWEKQLHQIFDETTPVKLESAAKQSLAEYFSSLPKPGQATVKQNFVVLICDDINAMSNPGHGTNVVKLNPKLNVTKFIFKVFTEMFSFSKLD